MPKKSDLKTANSEEETETPGSETGDNTPATDLEGAGPSPSESAELSAIADDLTASMPEVQEHAINQEEQKQEQESRQYADLRDTDGNGFDPSIHKTNAQGEPTLSRLGKLVKKPGRKKGGKVGASVIGVKSEAEVSREQEEAKRRMTARASGTMAANALMSFGIALGGDEWQPRIDQQIGLDEKKMMEDAFADYFEATGKTDIPPGWALTIAIGGYTMPRFFMPKTKSRIGKAKQWIVQKWVNWKMRGTGMEAEVKPKPGKMEA